MPERISRKIVVIQVISSTIFVLILFISAGTLNWFAGWAYLMLLFTYSAITIQWVKEYNPGLIEERTGFKPNQKPWDKVFIIVLYIIVIAWLIVMPMDAVRYRWSAMPELLQAVGMALVTASYYIFYLTFKENPYLSSVVRIQEDRGQTVISTGLYSHIRHPMYSGGILFFLGTPLMLGSWFGILFVPVLVAMLAVRAVFEEKMLRNELEGYYEYMNRVKYRFIPHVW